MTVIHTCIDISLQQFPAERAQTRLAIGVSSVYSRFALWAGQSHLLRVGARAQAAIGTAATRRVNHSSWAW